MITVSQTGRKLFSSFLIPALIALILPSCFQKAELVGVVIDQSSNPISGAEVAIANSSFKTLTDQKGKYSLPYAMGSFTLKVQKPGYTKKVVELSISEKVQYPLENAILYRIPETPGLAVFESERYEQVPEGTLTSIDLANTSDPIAQLLSSKANTRFYHVEGMPAILSPSITSGFIDTDNYPKLIFKVGENAVIAQRDFGTSFSGDQGNVLDIKPELISDSFKIWRLPEEIPEGLYAFARPGELSGSGFGLYGRDLKGDNLVNTPVYLFEITRTGKRKFGSPEGYYPITDSFNQANLNSTKSADSGNWKDAYVALSNALKILPSKASEETESRLSEYFKNALNQALKREDWSDAKLIAQLQPPTHELKTLADRVINAADAEAVTQKGGESLNALARRWEVRAEMLVELQVFKGGVSSYERALELLAKDDLRDDLLNSRTRNIKASLAWLLSACPDSSVQNPVKGVEYARSAVVASEDNASWEEWFYWRNLAVAFAAVANFEDAVRTQERALLLMSSNTLGDGVKQAFLSNVKQQVALLMCFQSEITYDENSKLVGEKFSEVDRNYGGIVSQSDLLGHWRHPRTAGHARHIGSEGGMYSINEDKTFELITGGTSGDYYTGTWELADRNRVVLTFLAKPSKPSELKQQFQREFSISMLSDSHMVWVDEDSHYLVMSDFGMSSSFVRAPDLYGEWQRLISNYHDKNLGFLEFEKEKENSNRGLSLSSTGFGSHTLRYRTPTNVKWRLVGDSLVFLNELENFEYLIIQHASASRLQVEGLGGVHSFIKK